jgi:hypothetical protein
VQAAYEAASAELQETQHRMMQAQEWLSSIRASLADQETDTDTEKEDKETRQEMPLRTIITPSYGLVHKGYVGNVPGVEKSAAGGATSVESPRCWLASLWKRLLRASATGRRRRPRTGSGTGPRPLGRS